MTALLQENILLQSLADIELLQATRTVQYIHDKDVLDSNFLPQCTMVLPLT